MRQFHAGSRAIQFVAIATTALSLGCGDKEPLEPSDPEVARIVVTPDSGWIFPGQTLQLSAAFYGSTGTVVSGGHATWQSDDVSVARVSTGGLVEAIRAGTTRISITAGGKSERITIFVGLAGSYDLKLANGEAVPGILSMRPVCYTDGTGSEWFAEYDVHARQLTFATQKQDPSKPDGFYASVGLYTEMSCWNAERTRLFFGAKGYLRPLELRYQVEHDTIIWSWNHLDPPPISRAIIKADSLIFKWNPWYGDSIRLHYVMQ